MPYTNESALIDDVYDYLFENDHNIGTNFLNEFTDSFVDASNAKIYLLGSDLGNYVIKIEKVD